MTETPNSSQEDIKLSGFRQQMSEYGLHPNEIMPDGSIHRFQADDDSDGKLSGAYWHNGSVGWFQNWKTMLKSVTSNGNLSEEDRKALSGSFSGDNEKVTLKALQGGISREWASASAPKDHPYLKRKGIVPPDNIKQKDDQLLITLHNSNREIVGLQRIFSDGTKKFIYGTRKKGAFYTIKGESPYFICEGFATGVSINMATGNGVIVAFDAGNIIHVARAVYEMTESMESAKDIVFIVASDDDGVGGTENKGLQASLAVHRELGMGVVAPKFKRLNGKSTTDFNDLHMVEGLDAVKLQLDAVIPTSAIDFPDNVISGIAGNYADMLANHIEAPKQFIYFSFLTCLGAILSDRLSMRVVHKPQPRLYTLLIGASGESRKSTTIDQVTNLFKMTLTSDTTLQICWGVGSEIGLMRKLNTHKSLLLCMDEFKQLSSKSSIRGSNLLPCIATLFDRNDAENHVKKESESVIVEDAYLSVLSASTPETYENTWDAQFTDIGLNNRLWVVSGEGTRQDALAEEIQEHMLTPTKIGIGKILQLVGNNLNLGITKEASDLYKEWYKDRENSIHSQRLEAYALRLMCLLTVNELKSEVDKEIVQKVITLCDWQLKVRKFYTPIDADNNVAKMEGRIRKQLSNGKPMSESELRKWTNANKSGIWIFDTAFKNLQKNELGKVKASRTIKYFIKKSFHE